MPTVTGRTARISLFSYDDMDGDLDLEADNPPDMRTLITLGGERD